MYLVTNKIILQSNISCLRFPKHNNLDGLVCLPRHPSLSFPTVLLKDHIDWGRLDLTRLWRHPLPLPAVSLKDGVEVASPPRHLVLGGLARGKHGFIPYKLIKLINHNRTIQDIRLRRLPPSQGVVVTIGVDPWGGSSDLTQYTLFVIIKWNYY